MNGWTFFIYWIYVAVTKKIHWDIFWYNWINYTSQILGNSLLGKKSILKLDNKWHMRQFHKNINTDE